MSTNDGRHEDAGSGEHWRPSPDDLAVFHKQVKGFKRTAAALSALALVAGIVALINFLHQRGSFKNGVRTDAVVVATHHHRRLTDTIDLAFVTKDGRPNQATVPVGSSVVYTIGQRTPLIYDPEDPRRARTVEDWNPLYETAVIWMALLLLTVWIILSWTRRWTGRVETSLGTEEPNTKMLAATVTTRIFGGATSYWGLLWGEDSPHSERPDYAYRIFSFSPELPRPEPVWVRGTVSDGSCVIARARGGAIWPLGKLREPTRGVLRAVARKRIPHGDRD